MISMEVRICTLDDTPIEYSPCYQTLLDELGEEDALKWTKVIDVGGDP